VEIFGVKLLGFTSETLRKLILTLIFALGILLLRAASEAVVVTMARRRGPKKRLSFFIRQTSGIFAAILLVLSLVSIWFDDPTRLATGVGLVSAGLAFALQKVVTSLAGYFVIIRGEVFSVGERITMGGVRGDVVALDFLKTTILEMGDPELQSAGIWVHGRQYTGRVVTVTNDKIFEEPVFNSTRDFPFLWDEIRIPITYATDRARAEKILLEAAEKHTAPVQVEAEPHRARLVERYHMEIDSLAPRVYLRITDNWLELSLRIISHEKRTRELKDQIARDILLAFDLAEIGIASTTIDIVGFPPRK
jgi:small-conductance mechanosensitive channel